MERALRDHRAIIGGGAFVLSVLVGMEIFGPTAVPLGLMALCATLLSVAAAGAALDIVRRSLT